MNQILNEIEWEQKYIEIHTPPKPKPYENIKKEIEERIQKINIHSFIDKSTIKITSDIIKEEEKYYAYIEYDANFEDTLVVSDEMGNFINLDNFCSKWNLKIDEIYIDEYKDILKLCYEHKSKYYVLQTKSGKFVDLYNQVFYQPILSDIKLYGNFDKDKKYKLRLKCKGHISYIQEKKTPETFLFYTTF